MSVFGAAAAAERGGGGGGGRGHTRVTGAWHGEYPYDLRHEGLVFWAEPRCGERRKA